MSKVTMHLGAVEKIIASVQRRVAQGDCPIEPAQSVETLEEVICELARARLRMQIENDPDEDPSAGQDIAAQQDEALAGTKKYGW